MASPKEGEMYYLIEEEYVGPNICYLKNVISICKKPGVTNLGREECAMGWLGTNDVRLDALGGFKTIKKARAEAHRRGFTVELFYDRREEIDGMDPDDIIEQWEPENALDCYGCEAIGCKGCNVNEVCRECQDEECYGSDCEKRYQNESSNGL